MGWPSLQHCRLLRDLRYGSSGARLDQDASEESSGALSGLCASKGSSRAPSDPCASEAAMKLVTQDEYEKYIDRTTFASCLHKDSDEKWVAIRYRASSANWGVKGRCVQNTANYVRIAHKQGKAAEAVLGFKLFKQPKPNPTAKAHSLDHSLTGFDIVAQVHSVVKVEIQDKTQDKKYAWVDVTPALDDDDRGHPIVFVPSTDLYSNIVDDGQRYASLAIAKMGDAQLEPRMGSVLSLDLLKFRQTHCPDPLRLKGSAREMRLVLAPYFDMDKRPQILERIPDAVLKSVGCELKSGAESRLVVFADKLVPILRSYQL